jgi:hypothetical protein
MFHKREIPLTRKKYGRSSHQYEITQLGIKTLSLDIVIPVMDLVIRKQ